MCRIARCSRDSLAREERHRRATRTRQSSSRSNERVSVAGTTQTFRASIFPTASAAPSLRRRPRRRLRKFSRRARARSLLRVAEECAHHRRRRRSRTARLSRAIVLSARILARVSSRSPRVEHERLGLVQLPLQSPRASPASTSPSSRCARAGRLLTARLTPRHSVRRRRPRAAVHRASRRARPSPPLARSTPSLGGSQSPPIGADADTALARSRARIARIVHRASRRCANRPPRAATTCADDASTVDSSPRRSECVPYTRLHRGLDIHYAIIGSSEIHPRIRAESSTATFIFDD